jgi:acyl transferase domain-containing protein/acyl carrier protein
VAEHEAAQLKQALDALTKMRVRLEAAERAKVEPIAIVGIGCRFPGGAHDADSFWSLVMERRDAVTEVPSDRWDVATFYDPDPLAAGKTSTRWGAFLEGIDRFDAAFFGISPREATRMDPQQRLLLEVAWNALEDAGVSPAGLAGQSAGVFVGVHSHSADYWGLQAHDRGGLDPYAGTGTSHSVLAGRLSYLLDLHGPSLAVDTACSSSLVAVHLAGQALRAGECGLALAAGVNVILTPEFTVAASRMQMLAADGRCKAFDARADGFVRGEGCGVVVLKRLADALAAGDPIRAVIRGSGVNQDGRTNGLTAPSGPSQSALIRSVLTAAGVAGREIGYVEAHGTGTPLGDPIEVEALAAALGDRGIDERCYLGSVKANVGHLEGAAGIAGLIKATLAVQRGMIPPQAQFERLNPHISLEGTGLAISTAPREWPASSSLRRAGVSSFGWSGTNAHVVVEQAPPAPANATGETEPRLLAVSARSREALHEVMRRYRDFLPASPAALDDITYTAALRRAHHPHRAAVVARANTEAASGLQVLLEGGLVASPAGEPGAPRVVFVFPGQGSQWLGMGRGLLQSSPVFRRAVEACDRALREHVAWSLLDQLTADETTSRLAEIDVVQPVLWAIQVALAAHWRAWGIEPAAVVGHSMGEIAAAHVAGALTLSDAASVICRRSRLMKSLSGRGRMALVELSRAEAERALLGHEAHLSVAVLNGPRSTVISGEPVALETVLAVLRDQGVFCREVSVDVASHSPQVDALLPALRAELRHLAPRAGTIPMYSTVTGRSGAASILDSDYWARNLREPVLFGATVEALVESGHTAFLEISPHPVLTPAVEDTLASLTTPGTVVGSLRRHEDEPAAMLESLGALWVAGCSVAWDRVFPTRRVPVALPAYPWQRERYWIERTESAGERTARGPRALEDHPLLGDRLDLAEATERSVWETELDGDAPDEQLEHRVSGVRMLAASAVVAMMATATREVSGGPRALTGIELRQPVAFPERGTRRRLQTIVAGSGAGARVAVYSRGDEAAWTLHAEARLAEAGPGRTSRGEPVVTITTTGASEPGEKAYQSLRRLGVEISDRLRVIRSVQQDAGAITATIDGDGASPTTHDATRLVQVLDAAFQLPTLGSILAGSRTVSMPMRLDECRIRDASGRAVAVRASRRDTAPEGAVWDLRLLDETGVPLAELVGLRLKDMTAAAAPGAGDLYEIQWPATIPSAHGLSSARGRWIVLADSTGVAGALSKQLETAGGRVITIATDPGWDQELRKQLNESDCRGVIALCGLDTMAGAWMGESFELCRTALGVVHAMLEMRQANPARLWLVTRGTQAVAPEGASRPLAMSLWGLGRVIAEEHPELWGGLVDLDPTATPEADGRDLLAALADSGEPEVAFRHGRRHAPRLRRVAAARAEGPTLRPDASYLITGGLGALGLRVARWMAEHGARHLVLLSRTPLPRRDAWSTLTGLAADRASALAEIESLGARVHHGAVDVADLDALRGFLDRYRAAGYPAIRGVVHTAAVIDDRQLHAVDTDSLERVWRPKAQGAWHLHQLLEHEALDFFALFSSLGSVLGQTGQGSYAVANAFLDGLAHHRATKGLPAVSVNWAGWAALGVAGSPGGRQVIEDLRGQGIAPLDPARALDLLAEALSGGRPQVVAVAMSRATAPGGGFRASRLLADLRSDEPAGARGRDATLAVELASLPAEDRGVRLERLLCESLGRVLKIPPEHVDRRKPLGSIGVDSLIALEFRRRLEAALGLALPATMIWNYPTVVELAAYLSSRISATRPASQPLPQSAGVTVDSSMERVDQLSDAEAAQALLAARRPSHGG